MNQNQLRPSTEFNTRFDMAVIPSTPFKDVYEHNPDSMKLRGRAAGEHADRITSDTGEMPVVKANTLPGSPMDENSVGQAAEVKSVVNPVQPSDGELPYNSNR